MWGGKVGWWKVGIILTLLDVYSTHGYTEDQICGKITSFGRFFTKAPNLTMIFNVK